MDERHDVHDLPDYLRKEEIKDTLKLYGGALAVVIFGILPWCVGMAMLTKWIFL